MTGFIQMNINLIRVETKRRQPLPVDSREKSAILRHVFQLLFRESQLTKILDLCLECFQKSFGILCFVPVIETKSTHCIGEQFDISVRGGKLIEVCI